MPRTIRFHLDENAPDAVAHGLRRLGADVTTTSDVGLRRAPDPSHIAYAIVADRVIFTEDEDFLAMAQAGIEHRGIAYFHPNTRSIGQIIAGL